MSAHPDTIDRLVEKAFERAAVALDRMALPMQDLSAPQMAILRAGVIAGVEAAVSAALGEPEP